tara:strand:+ start:2214 stop:2699 length:486 start_codon:yes stop_codon:yes gene_type:complete
MCACQVEDARLMVRVELQRLIVAVESEFILLLLIENNALVVPVVGVGVNLLNISLFSLGCNGLLTSLGGALRSSSGSSLTLLPVAAILALPFALSFHAAGLLLALPFVIIRPFIDGTSVWVSILLHACLAHSIGNISICVLSCHFGCLCISLPRRLVSLRG